MLGKRVGLALTVVIVIANAVGAAVVLVLAAWVLPTGPVADPARARAVNIAFVVGYVAVAVPVGVLWGDDGGSAGSPGTRVPATRHMP